MVSTTPLINLVLDSSRLARVCLVRDSASVHTSGGGKCGNALASAIADDVLTAGDVAEASAGVSSVVESDEFCVAESWVRAPLRVFVAPFFRPPHAQVIRRSRAGTHRVVGPGDAPSVGRRSAGDGRAHAGHGAYEHLAPDLALVVS